MKAAVNRLLLTLLAVIMKSNHFCCADYSYVIHESGIAELKCPFESEGNSTTKWTRQTTTKINCNSPEYSCDQQTLYIKNVSYEVGYTCKFCDDEMNCDRQSFLFVHYQTNFKSQLKIVPAHGNVFLECGVFTTKLDGVYTSGTLWFKHKKSNITLADSEEIIRKLEKDKDFWDHKYDALAMQNLYRKYDVELVKMHEFVGSVLVLFDVQSTNEGWYTCVNHFENKKYTTLIKSVYLRVVQEADSPEISPVQSVTAYESTIQELKVQFRDFFILTCPINGSAEDKVIWHHNNTEMKCNDGHRILCAKDLILVDSLINSDVGSYKCSQDNIQGNEVHVDIRNKSIERGIYTVKSLTMINQTANVKDSIDIDMKIPYHLGLASFGWLKHNDMQNTIDIVTKIDFVQIQTKKKKIYYYLRKNNILFLSNYQFELKLPEVTLNDAGFYTCLTYDYLTKTYELHTTQLIVTEPPQFIQTSADNLVYYEHADIFLKCEVKGSPKPSIKWYHNGTDVECPNNCDGPVLYIADANFDHNGNYECIVSNLRGTVKHNFLVTVVHRWMWTIKNSLKIKLINDERAFLNENVKMKCVTDQKVKEPKVFWIKSKRTDLAKAEINKVFSYYPFEQTKNDRSSYQYFLNVNNLTEIENGNKNELNLFNVTSQSEGWYSCVMLSLDPDTTNLLHIQGADSDYLYVNDEQLPTFVNLHPNKTDTAEILEGKPLKLSCLAVGKPEPVIAWYTNDSDIQCEQERVICRNSSFEFELKYANRSDSGKYKCKVCNTRGCIEHQTNVTISPNESSSFAIIMTATMVTFLIISMLAFIAYCFQQKYKKYKEISAQQSKTVHKWTKIVFVKKLDDYDPEEPGESLTPIIEIQPQKDKPVAHGEHEYIYKLDPNWEITRGNIELTSKLGSGAFGIVMMGRIQNFHSPKGIPIETIAVKMLIDEPTENQVINLVHEMEVMKVIGSHPNVINFLGCCTQDGPLWVIVEYAPYGNLKEFLEKRPRAANEYVNAGDMTLQDFVVTEEKLISFAYQIARGMEYLASKRCIHRDLAARNILVGYDYVMKIADFGLARDLQFSEYYRKNANDMLPVKWMAIESLEEHTFTKESDVWSYGVLLWEMWSYGATPYSTIKSAIEVYSLLLRGERLARPSNCREHIYEIMLNCWNDDPKKRPTFCQLANKFNAILENSASNPKYLELE